MTDRGRRGTASAKSSARASIAASCETRHFDRREPDDRVETRVREPDAERARDQGEQQRFVQALADDLPAMRAERKTHGDFAAPRCAVDSSSAAALAHAISSSMAGGAGDREQRRTGGTEQVCPSTGVATTTIDVSLCPGLDAPRCERWSTARRRRSRLLRRPRGGHRIHGAHAVELRRVCPLQGRRALRTGSRPPRPRESGSPAASRRSPRTASRPFPRRRSAPADDCLDRRRTAAATDRRSTRRSSGAPGTSSSGAERASENRPRAEDVEESRRHRVLRRAETARRAP